MNIFKKIQILAKNNNGVVALAAILSISFITANIIVSLLIVSLLFAQGNLERRLAVGALSSARSGINDAIYRVVLGDDLSLCTVANPCLLETEGNSRARVSVERDPADLGSCGVVWGCLFRIRSVGELQNTRRRLEVILEVGDLSREIRVRSFREIVV
ncbi:MAG: hypothetical protein KY053_00590 [Candidatus Liptonbacteria bacterium]|nr:hypothetical protein [Candidatus Liptonbacteria bacterium]